MAFDVFISYSSKDKVIADTVCAKLEENKIRCWMPPRDIPPGKEWAQAIAEAIPTCKVMRLIFSSHANLSKQVAREVAIAFNFDLTVIPFRIEKVMPTGGMLYYLNNVQWLDALTPQMETHLNELAAKTLANLLPLTKTNPKDRAEMILIPAGEFLMGDDDNADMKSNNPRHKVTLSACYIYKNLVTVAMYEKFCKEMKREMPPAPNFNSGWSKKGHPIVNVSWDDANAYCQWAGGRLPTEAQWEKAARGTEGRKFPWGDEFDTDNLQCSKIADGSAGGTALSGSFVLGASPYGVLDMAGNVWQWCQDYYDEGFWKSDLASLPNPVNESQGDEMCRVLRGGSWCCNDADNFRCAFRVRDNPSIRENGNGFRVVFSGLP